MSTREERILAKMAAMRAAKEEREITREAKRRLQAEEAAAKQKAYLESDEGKLAQERLAKLQEEHKAKLLLLQKEKEDAESIKPVLKLAFQSYYSSRYASEYNSDIHSDLIEVSSTMFKKHQKALIDMCVTVDHLNSAIINRVRIEPEPFSCGYDINWRNKVYPLDFILTAEKPLIETQINYKYNYRIKWID